MKKTTLLIGLILSLAAFSSACSDDDSARCGDGVINAGLGEECDGRSLGGYTCQDVDSTTLGGVLRCHPPGTENACTFDLSQCSRPTCGNGLLEPGEECDGYDLNGQTCVGLGHDAGQLGCTGPEDPNPCTIDESGCLDSPYCGDGNVDVGQGEECDGNSMNGETCATLGFLGGTLNCDLQCQFDTSNCQEPICGNDTREATELCDGTDLNGETCITRGYLEGSLGCESDCMAFDETGCSGHPVCGDGLIQGNEACDGTNLGGESCLSKGYLEGDLACATDCLSFDEAGCSGTNNCTVDHSLGVLQPGTPVTVNGDLSTASDDNATSCAMFPMGNPDEVIQFTLAQGGDLEVEFDFGMMSMGNTFALFNAATANCDDQEISCESPSGAGTTTFAGLAPGSYYIITEGSVMGGGPYTMIFSVGLAEICDNGIDDNSNGLIDCEDGVYCCGEPTCSSDPAYCQLDGASCTADASCQGGLCFDEPNTGWPAGLCTSDCGGSGVCETGFECVQYSPDTVNTYDVCIPTCTGPSTDSRDGYLCSDFGNGLLACYPDCTDNSHCPDTGTCNLESGFCEPSQGLEATGGECTTYEDCEGGACFTETDFGVVGGHCTSMCSLSNPVCPNGGVCVNYFDTAADDGYCFVACNDVNDCRDTTNFECVSNPHYPPPADTICNWN